MSEPVHVSQIAPTPERGWLWRRLFSFALAAALLVLVYSVIRRLTDASALRAVALALLLELALVQLLYMGGATLTDIWRLVSAVRTTRHIVESRKEGA